MPPYINMDSYDARRRPDQEAWDIMPGHDAGREREQRRLAAERRLADFTGAEDLTASDLESRPRFNAQQDQVLGRYLKDDELSKIRAEMDADPEAFGGGRVGTATAEIGGKRYKMKSVSRPNTGQILSRTQQMRIEAERAKNDALEERKLKAEEAKANVPVRVAEIGAASNDKRSAAEERRAVAQETRIANNETRQRTLEDEVRDRNRATLNAQAQADARNINERGSERKRRRGQSLKDWQAEVRDQGLEWDRPEQEAALRRLMGSNEDVADLTDEEIQAQLVRPTAKGAEEHYGDRIKNLSTFLEDNYVHFSDADKEQLRTDLGALLTEAKDELDPGQYARFKNNLKAKLRSGLTGNTFWDLDPFGDTPTARRQSALEEIFNAPSFTAPRAATAAPKAVRRAATPPVDPYQGAM